MCMELETAKRLRDASAACGELIDMSADRSRDDMHDDRMFQLASRKLIEIVGKRFARPTFLTQRLSILFQT